MTEHTTRRRPRFWILIGLLALVVIVIVAVAMNLPKPLSVSDASFDLSSIEDGIYGGEYNNGLVFVRVEVTIQGNTIAGVRILEHRNGMGQPAEAITEKVVSSQSLEVDAISGATMSSQTILKAIENALINS